MPRPILEVPMSCQRPGYNDLHELQQEICSGNKAMTVSSKVLSEARLRTGSSRLDLIIVHPMSSIDTHASRKCGSSFHFLAAVYSLLHPTRTLNILNIIIRFPCMLIGYDASLDPETKCPNGKACGRSDSQKSALGA